MRKENSNNILILDKDDNLNDITSMKYDDSNINNSILKLSKHVWKNINFMKKYFDNFLRGTENFKINERSNLSLEKDTEIENFKKNIDEKVYTIKIWMQEDKYKRLLSLIISSINNLSTSENFHTEDTLTKEQQMKENEVNNKEISDVGTISFLDNNSDQDTQFTDYNPSSYP